MTLLYWHRDNALKRVVIASSIQVWLQILDEHYGEYILSQRKYLMRTALMAVGGRMDENTGARTNPESLKRYRDVTACVPRQREESSRKLRRLTASSNDIAREREKKRGRKRDGGAATRVVSDACNRYRLTTLDPTSAATPSLPPPLPTPLRINVTTTIVSWYQHDLKSLAATTATVVSWLFSQSIQVTSHPCLIRLISTIHIWIAWNPTWARGIAIIWNYKS